MTRIIAGRAKGARLVAPVDSCTRPTSDRVREAVFSGLASWLGTVDDPPESQLAGIRFLDLYSGTGAMCLEAVSRGAEGVAVERDRKVAQSIRANASALKLPLRVHSATVDHFITQSENPDTADRAAFDVVWLDPPYEYGSDEISAQIRRVISAGLVVSDGLVIAERSSRSDPLDLAEAEDGWTKTYGETVLFYWVPGESMIPRLTKS